MRAFRHVGQILVKMNEGKGPVTVLGGKCRLLRFLS